LILVAFANFDKISGESREEPRLKKSRSSGPGTNTFESYSHHVSWGKKKSIGFNRQKSVATVYLDRLSPGFFRRSLKCSASYWGFPESNSHHSNWLVVLTCFNHLEKYASMGKIIPCNMEKEKMFETTNQPMRIGRSLSFI